MVRSPILVCTFRLSGDEVVSMSPMCEDFIDEFIHFDQPAANVVESVSRRSIDIWCEIGKDMFGQDPKRPRGRAQ